MNKALFILDENVDRRFANYLKEKGFSVDYCPKGISDDRLFEIVVSQGGILITNDSDFRNSDRYLPKDTTNGIVVFDTHPRLLANLISCFDILIQTVPPEMIFGSIITANPTGVIILRR